jgi:outer membrane protein assembly factor BamB
MPLIVTSASGSNGNGYGALLAFDVGGQPLGRFSNDGRIVDPRGLGVDRANGLLFVNSGADRILALDATGRVVRDTGPIEGLNPGGGNFGPDGRYYIGLRSERSIMAFDQGLDAKGEYLLPTGVVPFPRGFSFDATGRSFLASGIGPTGEGDDTIIAFTSELEVRRGWHFDDPDVSPLDLAIAPNGNVIVSSETPFGVRAAVTTIREYDAENGRLVRVLSPDGGAMLEKPRGLRFGADGKLYCAAQDEVVVFDFDTGECLGAAVELPRLNGQALIFFGD